MTPHLVVETADTPLALTRRGAVQFAVIHQVQRSETEIRRPIGPELDRVSSILALHARAELDRALSGISAG